MYLSYTNMILISYINLILQIYKQKVLILSYILSFDLFFIHKTKQLNIKLLFKLKSNDFKVNFKIRYQIY